MREQQSDCAHPIAALSRITTCGLLALAALLVLSVCTTPASALRQLHVKATVATHYPEPNANVTVRVKAVDQKGRTLKGVRCVATWHLRSTTPKSTRRTNRAGVVRFTRYIGDTSGGYGVWVTVKGAWRGQTRRCKTWFRPRRPLPDVPNIVFIGDSLTVGLYAVTEAESFRALIAARFMCTSELIGTSGGQSKDVSLVGVTEAAGDIVVIELGTNDAIGYPDLVPVAPAVLEANLRAIARAARSGNQACRLIFLSVWQQAPTRTPYDARIAAVAASYGRHFIDISTIKDDPAASRPAGVDTYLGISDGWHPNTVGHAAIAGAVGDEIAKMLDPKFAPPTPAAAAPGMGGRGGAR